MNRYSAIVFAGFAFAATACSAHAAQSGNLCPSGTKVAVLSQPTDDPELPIEMPPSEGAYDDSAKVWDISNAGSAILKVDCYPSVEGFAGGTTANVPKGSKSCSFANGIMSCKQ